MIKVKDLNTELFESPFLSYLPKECESCGSDTEVVETLSSLQCSNKHCISKVGYRLFSLLQDLGIDKLSVDECIKFLKTFDTLNPYSIFLYNPNEDGELFEGYTMEKSFNLYNLINRRRGMLLWQFIKIGHLNNLNTSAEKIIGDYQDINKFYNDLLEGGVSFIQSKLCKDVDEEISGILVEAVLIYESLIEYKEEIIEGINGVVIINPKIQIKILFAEDTDKYVNNSEFLFEINRKLKNKIYLYEGYFLDETIKLIYWRADKHRLYNSIIKMQKEDYPEIPLVDEDNILKVLVEELTKYAEK